MKGLTIRKKGIKNLEENLSERFLFHIIGQKRNLLSIKEKMREKKHINLKLSIFKIEQLPKANNRKYLQKISYTIKR